MKIIRFAPIEVLRNPNATYKERQRALRERVKEWGRRKRKLVKNRVCGVCGTTENLSFDHIIPISRGGSDEPENIQTLCRVCNSRKGVSPSVNPSEWPDTPRGAPFTSRLRDRCGSYSEATAFIERGMENAAR